MSLFDRFTRDYYLTGSYLLPSPAGKSESGAYEYHPEYNEFIKEQILDKRGVYIGFCADVSRPDQDLQEQGNYLNNITWAHYTWDENASPNHAVVLIGWDDNYPKENFLEGHQPPGDGAWLVRNSWGSGEEPFPNAGEMNWGIPVETTDENGNTVTVGSGYFWLSYYDCSLYGPEAFIFSDSGIPEYVDQHDYLPVNQIMEKRSRDVVKMANVFTPEHGELLTSFSCMTATMNTEVSYEIYLLCNDFETPDEGLLVSSGLIIFEFGGYHKVDLPEWACIQAGQSYSIILCMQGDDGQYIRNQTVGTSIENLYSMNAVVNKRESFLFRNGGWEDYKQIVEQEIAEDPISQMPGISTCGDNFPIKGYANQLAADLAMVFNVTNSQLVMVDGYNSTKVKLYFLGDSGLEMGNPEVTWRFLNGSEENAHFVTQKNGSQIELTADKTGPIYLAVSLDEQHSYGTAVLKIVASRPVPRFVVTMSPTNTYTGEPIEPEFIVQTEKYITLREGVDYTIEYLDNVRCGIARVVVTPIVDDPDAPVPAPITTTFDIVPPKTEITGYEGSGHEIRLTFKDYLEIGAAGYEVEYRKTGDVDWTVKAFDNVSQCTIDGLDSNQTYEVRARSYITEHEPWVYNVYGGYSDTVLIAVK
ncbi:MAG: hypothetical protein IKM91_06815 [Candidatus Methanomethylophilaceae archaeon]|nr:hypothetical protein [Candidatus Methanomethylophilaceae archaeon]